MMKILKILFLLGLLTVAASLSALSEVTDDWAASCLNECSRNAAGGSRCSMGSIRFIADQYARAVKGEPYWKSSRGRRFANRHECAEYRMNEIRAICPAAFEVLRKNLR